MPFQDVDLAVIGLGAMGAAVAWQAAARGLSVVGFDALEPPHDRGSTHGHSRIIREAYFEHPQYVPLVQRAYTLWAELEQLAGTRLFHACGGVMVGPPAGAIVEGTRRAASLHGLTTQVWDTAELGLRMPALRPEAGMVAVFEPRAGVLTPERAVTAMLQASRRAGGTLYTSEPVTAWEPIADGVEVRSEKRRVRARRMVLATGAWLPELSAAPALPLVVERMVQYWYDTSGDPVFQAARFPVFLLEAPDGRVLYGLPDQGHGLKLAEHHGGATVGPSTVDREVSPEEMRRFHAFAARWVSRLPEAPMSAKVCLYTNTPDGDFILDWHPEAAGVFLCSACSGHGFKFAPVIGEIVAAAAAGDTPRLDISPFTVERFAPA